MKKLKKLNPTNHELIFLQKVLIDIRNRGHIREHAINIDPSTIKNTTIYADVDNTIILYPPFTKNRKDKLMLKLESGDYIKVFPHKEHIKHLKTYSKNGNKVILWSAAGGAWAKQVAKALKITKYIDLYLDKPNTYYDDLEVTEWMKYRVWFKDKK